MRQILLLGAPRVEENAFPVEIERRKALALLAYLAVTRTTHTREALTAFFFPDVDEARGLAYLRTGLWTLNKALGDDWVVLDGDTVRFNAAANIFVDIYQLEAAAIAGRTNPTTPQGHRERVALLTEAAGLYRGDFMAGFLLRDTQPFEDWQLVHTEQVRRTFADILERLVESHIALGDFEPAKTYALRWLDLDAMNEKAVRQVMRLYTWTGQHSAALRLYRDTAALLKRELDVEIDEETTALSTAIQSRRVPPPALAKADASHRRTSTGEHPVIVVDLPAQATPFVGRTMELSEIERLIDDPVCRLLTLIGAGGIGKTRLALQTAQQIVQSGVYRDGVVFVPLAPVTHEDFFLYTIAEALHLAVSTQREMDLGDLVLRYLQDKHLLLVLDNFEHLPSCAVTISNILTHAPKVKILVTSRERLDLREEWLFEIKGLDQSTDALQLFLQSARRVRPDFALEREDQQSVERIIGLVEGMPLAIELAAVWVQMLSCQEIAQEIQKGIDFLTTNARNVPERHRSLRAVFESSWQRLNDQEQQCLSRLSVLHTFRAETAQVVAGASLPLLLTLMGKSLLRRTDSGRFEIHELLRQFAGSKLTSSDALQTVDRYGAYFAEFLAARETALKTSKMPEALHELQDEIDNIRNSWLYYIYRKDVQRLAQMLDPLMIIYGIRQTHQESVEMMQKALDALKATSDDPSERLLVGRLMAARAWSYMNSGRPNPVRIQRPPGNCNCAAAGGRVCDRSRRPGRKN
jgi:predicted ATPase/DNA-binding SARP family transcriptional activator